MRAVAEVAAGIEAVEPTPLPPAEWWVRSALAAPGYALARLSAPALAGALRGPALAAAASNAVLFEALATIEARFAEAGLPLVLLKGAAVAGWAYVDPALRPMTDLDLWVRKNDLERAAVLLAGLGFERRPGREVAFSRGNVRVELHDTPFRGVWTYRTATPDVEGAWHRAEPAGPGRHARRLAPEDAVLQVVVHTVVNVFSQWPLRALLDLAAGSRRRTIDWEAVSARAKAARLRTATWLVLDLADRIFGIDGVIPALERLRPGVARRASLASLVRAESLLLGRVPRAAARRHSFLLAVVDRPEDGARLFARALWPEPAWLATRYGEGANRIRHLRALAAREEERR
jgi:hypothetical protein